MNGYRFGGAGYSYCIHKASRAFVLPTQRLCRPMELSTSNTDGFIYSAIHS